MKAIKPANNQQETKEASLTEYGKLLMEAYQILRSTSKGVSDDYIGFLKKAHTLGITQAYRIVNPVDRPINSNFSELLSIILRLSDEKGRRDVLTKKEKSAISRTVSIGKHDIRPLHDMFNSFVRTVPYLSEPLKKVATRMYIEEAYRYRGIHFLMMLKRMFEHTVVNDRYKPVVEGAYRRWQEYANSNYQRMLGWHDIEPTTTIVNKKGCVFANMDEREVESILDITEDSNGNIIINYIGSVK